MNDQDRAERFVKKLSGQKAASPGKPSDIEGSGNRYARRGSTTDTHETGKYATRYPATVANKPSTRYRKDPKKS